MSDPVTSPAAPVPPAWRGWVLFLVTMGTVLGLGLMVASIQERRVEGIAPAPMMALAAYETDNAKWGVNWPRQWSGFQETQITNTQTKHAGAAKRDLLAETPANVVLFAGYAFAVDYNQARGHGYAIDDVKASGRDISTKPGTCWTCKSPDVPRLMAEMGPATFYDTPAKELTDQIQHPIGCLDCHDPKTMALRISRPALTEAMARQGKDIADASHQEMRTLVCAQCHVEYYFKKDESKGQKAYLTFPWDQGLTVEGMEKYYADNGFTDWKHLISGTKMIKMQHPDYEVYSQGIHAYRNVSCADCHMPYKTEGGRKVTDHHIQSPLLNIANSCAVCHRWGEEEVRSRVESIQDKIIEGRHLAEAALSKAHFDIAACMQIGYGDEDLKAVRDLLRKAQMKWDYVAANNGLGFHAPQECQRILAGALDGAQQTRLAAARLLAAKSFASEVLYPDVSTKEKAQALNKDWKAGHAPKLLPDALVVWMPPAAPAPAAPATAAATATAAH